MVKKTKNFIYKKRQKRDKKNIKKYFKRKKKQQIQEKKKKGFKPFFSTRFISLNPKTNIILIKKYFKKKVKQKVKKKKNILLKKFICLIMKKGKKIKAENLFYSSLSLLNKKIKIHPFFLLWVFINKFKIPFRLLGIRIRGKSVGVPVPLKLYSQYYDAFRIFIKQVNSTEGLNFINSFVSLYLGLNNKTKNSVMLFKQNLLQTAVTNKRYLRYRW